MQATGPQVPFPEVPRRVWTSTGMLVAGRVWATLSTFAGWAVLARHLDSANFGRLTFYLVLLALLDSWADCGTSTAALQRGAESGRTLAQLIRAGRRIRAVAALGGWAIVSTAAWLAGEPGLACVALAALMPVTRVFELSTVVYPNELRWGVPVTARISTATLRLAAVLVLVQLGTSEFGPFLLAHALLGGLTNIVLHWIARGRIQQLAPLSRVADRRVLRELLVMALPLAAAGLAQQAYFYIDNLVLFVLVGESPLGHYNAAVRTLTLMIMVAGFATNAALPWLARRATAGDLHAATIRLARPLSMLGCLGLVVLWPFAGVLLRGLFGPAFGAATASLRWLLVAGAIIYVGSGYLTAVVASGRSGSVLRIVIGGLAINLAGNLMLVPHLGIEGAAIATVATELFVTCASVFVLRRAPGNRRAADALPDPLA